MPTRPLLDSVPQLLLWGLIWLVPAGAWGQAAPSSPSASPPLPLDPVVRAAAEDASLNGLAVVTEDRVVAVGDRGSILLTGNEGLSWQAVNSGTSADLYDVASGGAATQIAVGGQVGSYTGMSYGVILRSVDGGLTWTPVPTDRLPRLTGIQSTPVRWIAWGDYSPLWKTSVFESFDQGLTWRGLDCGLAHATAAAGSAQGDVLAVDHLGRSFNSAVGASAAPIARVEKPLRRLHHTGDRWLACGGGGELIASLDGQEWSNLELPMSADARQYCHWNSIAQQGDSLWVAGSPGSLILHSPDRGTTWRVLRTGGSIPLRGVAFADQNRGWAVGPLGTVLATRDGGKNWYAQRRHAERLGVLAVTASQDDCPWTPLVAAAWDEAVSCGAIVLDRDEAVTHADFLPARSARLQSAARQMGLAFHGTDAGMYSDPERLAQHLALQLRTWRPEVVLASSEEGKRPAAGTRLPQLVRTAWQLSEQEDESLGRELGLAAWSPAKLVGVCSEDASQFSEQSGRILRGPGLAIWDILLALPPALRQPGERTYMRTELARSGAKAVSHSLLGGIAPTAEIRRQVKIENVGNYQLVMGRIHLEKTLNELLRSKDEIDRWLGDLKFLLRSIPEREVAPTLAHAAEQLKTPEQAVRRRAMLELLASQAGSYDASNWARLELLRTLHSREIRTWRETNQLAQPLQLADETTQPLRRPSAENRTLAETTALGGWSATPFAREETSPPPDEASAVPVITASATEPAVSKEPATIDFFQIFDAIHQLAPDVTSRPDVELLVASAYSRRDLAEGSAKHELQHLDRIASASHLVGWPQVARQEILLRNNRLDTLRWVHPALESASRPTLDGRLDESFWQAAPRMQLTDWRSGPLPPAEVRWAYDTDYLYISVVCPRPVGAAIIPQVTQRTYDSDLSETDHVSFWLDVDRDYNTGFEFGIAEDGRTFDRCHRVSEYNPKWHVAVNSTDREWTAEVAIDLAALTLESDLAGEAWGVCVQRTAADGAQQSWGQLRSHRLCPQACGLLLFSRP